MRDFLDYMIGGFVITPRTEGGTKAQLVVGFLVWGAVNAALRFGALYGVVWVAATAAKSAGF